MTPGGNGSPPLRDGKNPGPRPGTGTGSKLGVKHSPLRKTKSQVSKEFTQWLKDEVFDNPAGRELIKAMIFSEPSVLNAMADRAMGKVRHVVDLHHHGLSQYTDEQLEQIAYGRTPDSATMEGHA